MPAPIDTARKCFEENLMGLDPQEDPEKFNLYTGLSNLAEAISEIETKLEYIENQLQR